MASRTVAVGAVIAGALCAPACLTGQVVTAGVDPRVELMSIIFRLAGSPEYNQCRVPAYNQAIDRHFARFRNHKVVQLARQLRKTDGVAYNAVMSMAVQIKDVKSLAERVPFDRRDLKLDSRWKGAKARRFLGAARRFVADTRFSEFLKSQQQLYDVTNAKLRPFVATSLDPAWFGRYFGVHRPADRQVRRSVGEGRTANPGGGSTGDGCASLRRLGNHRQ